MAELSEAFNSINFETKNFHSIDYFFTQRNLKEEHEYLDKNMNRKNRHINMLYNFLAISIPHCDLVEENKFIIDIDIFGDIGYHYKGKIITIQGVSPSFMIPIKADKKLFIHLIYRENDKESEIKECICFIEVPKRFQSVDSLSNKLKNETSVDI
jgi:hypothetical protein